MRDGMITEEQCGENFAYILEDKTDFLITEYKMMHGQEADFLLKCVKMLYNGKTELYYDTKSCLPLAIRCQGVGRYRRDGFLFWEIFCMKSEG